MLSSTTRQEPPPDASVESDENFFGDLWWSVREGGPTPNILPRLVTIVQMDHHPMDHLQLVSLIMVLKW